MINQRIFCILFVNNIDINVKPKIAHYYLDNWILFNYFIKNSHNITILLQRLLSKFKKSQKWIKQNFNIFTMLPFILQSYY